MSDIHGLPIDEIKPDSLYLIFEDGTRLDFVHDEIKMKGYQFLDDSSHVPPEVREAASFQRCAICPECHKPGYCHAILPIVSTFERIDHYPSYTPVTAIYRDPIGDGIVIRETTLQIGLQFISILSLIHFCELGRQYIDLFWMVHPLMGVDEVAARIYLNLFWQTHGDEQKTDEILRKFSQEMQVTVRCQTERLRLICKSDAFLNSFIMMHVMTHFLQSKPVDFVNKYVGEYRAKYR